MLVSMHQLLVVALGLLYLPYIRSCCSPNVLQCDVMEYGFAAEGKESYHYQNMVKVYYDADEKKVAKKITAMMGNKPTEELVIADYVERKRYVITNGNICNVMELKEQFKKSCVTPNAKFLGSTVLGNTNSNMRVDMYSATIQKGGLSAEADFMVTPMDGGDCTLVGVVENIKREGKLIVSESSVYMNFTFEIPDKSVFKPPSECFGYKSMGGLFFEVIGGYQKDLHFDWGLL